MNKTLLIIGLVAIALSANALEVVRDESSPLKISIPVKLRYWVEYCSERANVRVRDEDGSTSSGSACVGHDYRLRTKTVNQVIKFKGAAAYYQGAEVYSLEVRNTDGDDFTVLIPVNDLAKTRSIHKKSIIGTFIVE